MRAKPGPRAKWFPPLNQTAFKPPRRPRGLTQPQVSEWKRLVSNPALGQGDADLLLDYCRSMRVRDLAEIEIEKKGVFIQGEPNPACRVLRDSQTHILRLRKLLCMNQRERMALQKSGLLEPPGDDDDWMVD